MGVYPRVCGGTFRSYHHAEPGNLNGSIPACAGEPALRAIMQSLEREGLSPRVRGNRKRADCR